MRMTASWFGSLDPPNTRLWRDRSALERGLPSNRHLADQPDCIRWCRRARSCQGACRVVAEEATSLDSSCARTACAAVAGRDEETGFQIEQRKTKEERWAVLAETP